MNKFIRIYLLTSIAVSALIAILPEKLAEPLMNVAMTALSWSFGLFMVVGIVATILYFVLSLFRA